MLWSRKSAPLYRFTLRIVLVAVLSCAFRSATGQANPPAVPLLIPTEMTAMSAAVTPREYAEIIASINRIAKQPEVAQELDQGAGLGDLNLISVTRVPLGSLGDGMMVEFHAGCGTGGCPLWLLLRGTQGYKRAFCAGAWGFSLQPSGSTVPDIALYWHMSAGETDISRYHYAAGKFVPVKGNPDTCETDGDKQGACAGLDSA